MKLTRLIQLGLVGSSFISLTGALSSCTVSDASQPPDSAAAGSLGIGPGGPGNPLAGASSVGQAGSSNLGSAGANASGGVPAQAGSSSTGSNGGSLPVQPCTDLPPNNGDTCAHALEFDWCSESWIGESCKKSCGKCSSVDSGTGAGGAGLGGASSGGYGGGGGQPPAIQDGKQGWASRYWDCCKPACGWTGNVPGGSTPVHSCNKSDQSLGGSFDTQNACEGNQSGAYMCQDFGPWAVSDSLAYGFAAVNMGGDYCGKCYQIEFAGTSHSASNDPGSQSLKGKTMIVQAINTGGIDGTQFDLLIPGGGVGDFDACTSQWGTSDLGERYGGFYLACQKANGFAYAASRACAATKCATVFKDKPDLLAGCNFFINWMGAPDNPNLLFKETACPAAITQKSGLKR